MLILSVSFKISSHLPSASNHCVPASIKGICSLGVSSVSTPMVTLSLSFPRNFILFSLQNKLNCYKFIIIKIYKSKYKSKYELNYQKNNSYHFDFENINKYQLIFFPALHLLNYSYYK